MPRANRHFHPGQVWHITHRCHKQQFLLRFAKDRRRWLYWLFEARKRYGLCVLNYTVTSNHIHLLVEDSGRGEIPRSMQLIAGRTAQQYNQRKKRKGAFWEDRYHATAVQTDEHLFRCLVYIDLNMVRAGVVSHPSAWSHGGYMEIQIPPQRRRIVDQERLTNLLGFGEPVIMREAHAALVQEAVEKGELQREPRWTESIAVGHSEFLKFFQEAIRTENPGRRIIETADSYELREASGAYLPLFEGENSDLRTD